MTAGEDPAAAGSADVVVLAGGAGVRFRRRTGADKLSAPIGDSTVIGRLLADLHSGWNVFLVTHPFAGPAVVTSAGVQVVHEEPAHRGPLVGAAAGLRRARSAVVVLLAGDQPFAAPAVPRLLAALDADPGAYAAVGLDPDGRRQPLLAAVRRAAALDVLADADRDGVLLDGRLGTLLFPPGRRVLEVPVSAREAHDVDEPADLARAVELARGTAGDESPPGAGARTVAACAPSSSSSPEDPRS